MLQITALSIFLLAFAGASWWLLSTGRLSARNWCASALVFGWLAGVGFKLVHDRLVPDDDVAELLSSVESVSWSEPQGQARRDTPSKSGPAPVEALIGGLEARLEADPADGKGWALLAQSYAFIGDTDRAERAIARAVALGFVESDLRERVESARGANGAAPAQSAIAGG